MKKYTTAFGLGVSNSMEYRFDFFINLLSTVFPIIMQIFIWISMYQNGADTLYGYTFPQMIMYVVVAGAVGKFTSTGVEYLVNEDIRSGGIAKYLVKPVNYIGYRLMDAIGNKAASMFTMIVLTIVALITLLGIVGFTVAWQAVLLFFPALLFAAMLNFFLFFCMSMTAFWLTDIGNFFHAMSVIIMVLSGGVFPVTVFGKTYALISKYIPLTYTINYPIQILSGTVSVQEAVGVLGIQLVWIIILALLAVFLWQRGLKKYVAVGG